MNRENTIKFEYLFEFQHNPAEKFVINLSEKTLNLIRENEPFYPDWVKLEYYQCENCPLNTDSVIWCPVAQSIHSVVARFSDVASYETVKVTVSAKERIYIKEVSLQDGLGSLIGIYMVVSGCPIMSHLKPLVRYHLPFSTMRETEYRVISLYLLSQYFSYKHGKKPDWELNGLTQLYKQIRKVNIGFTRRIQTLQVRDATINAIINLDCYATILTKASDLDRLLDLQKLLATFFDLESKKWPSTL